MEYETLANSATDLDDIIVGKRPQRKKNHPQETWNIDSDYNPGTKRHYIGTDHYLSARAVQWYKEKTGFPLHLDHCDFFFTLPFGFAHKLITLPHGQTNTQYELGIAFCHSDGTILQYRPNSALPSWELSEGKWVPGRPIRYFTISQERLSADGVTLVKIPPKPLFVPKLREYPNSPNVLVVTEGFTKAACLSHLGFDTIHLPGVTLWDTPSAQEVFKSHQGKYDFFVLAFDSDSQINPTVRREQLKFAKTYNARVASWAESAKGFDDLCLQVGVDDVKTLRGVILDSKALDTGYQIFNRQKPYPSMLEVIEENHPGLFFDGMYWVNQGNRLSQTDVDKILINELQKFYVIGKGGKEYIWATRYKEVLEYLYLHLSKSDNTNITFLSNGYFDAGTFYPTSTSDPRAFPWSLDEEFEEPTELVNFFQRVHGNEDYRYWLRSLFDNSIPYGSILGVTGESGSGKSVTLSIAQALLGELHCQSLSLTMFEKNERIAGMGNPKALIQSDCQKLPERMDELFIFTDSNPISVRNLYQTGFQLKRFYCRVAFGFVNLPYVAGANEGFSRRFKLITCQKYPNMVKDVEKIVRLMKDKDYLNRVFNWVMRADRGKTVKFMDATMAEGISAEIKAQPTYKFFDQTLIPESPKEEVSVREYYEAFTIFCQRQRRRAASFEDFLITMKRVGITVHPGANFRLPNGTFLTTDDLMGVKVDERILSIVRLESGSFYGINCRYFSTREIKEKRRGQEGKGCLIKFANEVETNTLDTSGDNLILINPDLNHLNEISHLHNILSVEVEPGYSFTHPLISRIVTDLKVLTGKKS